MFPQVKKSRRLPFPVTEKLRVVQVGHGRLFEGAERISSKDANVLVGPASELKALAETCDLRIDHAIFVFTRPGDRPLNDVLRVTLWQNFGVPVFELLIDENQNIYAAECEAHEGLHLVGGTIAVLQGGELVLASGRGKKIHTGFSAVLEHSECACGSAAPRIVALEPRPVLAVHQLAATA